MANITELIASIQTTLAFLDANEATMPHDLLRQQRNQAMTLGTTLLNQHIDHLTSAQVRQVSDLVVMLDRVGY